jgi:hypothetical protein
MITDNWLLLLASLHNAMLAIFTQLSSEKKEKKNLWKSRHEEENELNF